MADDSIREAAKLAASFLSGGFVGTFIGHRLTLGREAEGRRRTFRGKLRSIDATIQAARNRFIYEAYTKTVPEVRELCAGIRDDVSRFRRKRLEAACAAYCSLTEPEVRVSAVRGFYDESVTTDERDRRTDESHANLKRLLEAIIQCA